MFFHVHNENFLDCILHKRMVLFPKSSVNIAATKYYFVSCVVTEKSNAALTKKDV